MQTSKNIWEDNLIFDKSKSLPDNLIIELAEYENISIDEAGKRLSVCKEELNRGWMEKGRKDPLAFYKQSRWYLYDLTLFHSKYGPHAQVAAVLEFCLSRKLTRILDFGGGIGSSGIIFARAGLEVAICDVSPTLLDYAKWRFDKRKLRAEFINLSAGKTLPGGWFDAAIATDVMEHLRDPSAELKRIHHALKNGGYLFFNITEDGAGNEPSHPMHISRAMDVIRCMRACGFRKAGNISVEAHRYQKVTRPDALNYALGIYDYIYYRVYFFVRFILLKAGLLSRIKTLLGKSN
ncbi:MAG: class I SAM-dependent methyltransferase [Candidatus Omnitrophica bacterium]|nr:class I SAM-dependent methyltransferase [Candidatus Omnitrophota bacterium]